MTQIREWSEIRSRRNTPWDYRHVIWNFAQRDLKARFKGTTLGWLWSLLVPLATVLVYTLVFSFFFRAQPPAFGNGRDGIFAVWFLVGLIPWAFLNNSVTRGMGSLIGAGRLMQKIYLPGFVPVLGTVVALLVQMLIELGILLVILIALGNASPVWSLLPLWAALYVPFAASFALILAVANVYVRDLSQIIGVVMQLLFFLTPIIYSITIVPERVGPIPARALIEASPFAQFVMTNRAILYANEAPGIGHWLALAAWAGAMTLVAWLVFRRYGRDLGEMM